MNNNKKIKFIIKGSNFRDFPVFGNFEKLHFKYQEVRKCIIRDGAEQNF